MRGCVVAFCYKVLLHGLTSIQAIPKSSFIAGTLEIRFLRNRMLLNFEIFSHTDLNLRLDL